MAYIVFVKYIIIPEGPSLLDTAVGGGDVTFVAFGSWNLRAL